MTVETILWLHEQDEAAGVKMWLQDKLVKSIFSGFCCNFRFVDVHRLLEPLYLVFFLFGANFYFSNP